MGNNIVAFGEVLWDLLPHGAVLGGAPFNFTYRAQSLGNNAVLISRLGSDDLGIQARKEITSLGLSTEYIQEDPLHPTGIVHVTMDEEKNPDYVIVENAAYDFTSYNEKLSGLAASADCLCFGSVVQRTETARKTLYRLLEDYRGRFALFDINLRKKCYTKKILHESLLKTDILKLNGDELEELKILFSLKGRGIAELSEELLERYGLSHCLVTLGEKGLYAAGASGDRTYIPAFQVQLADPIGSGDACTAGFIDSLLKGLSLEQACRFASAIGAVAAEKPGATHPITVEQIERMLKKGKPAERHPEFV